jgi:hypothetical protein
MFDSIVRALRSGRKVEIRGFGSFHTRQRAGRIGRNPKTGAKVEVPPKKIPFFKLEFAVRDHCQQRWTTRGKRLFGTEVFSAKVELSLHFQVHRPPRA